MTVAAVILSASVESALAPTEGQPRVRRLVDIAWSGGAVPIVVVAPDPDGRVASALAGAPVTLAAPAPDVRGPVGQIVRGIEVAAAELTGTNAALIWPAQLAWVDPETITSLIEAHGPDANRVLRPAYEGAAGWPALLPLVHVPALKRLAADRTPDELLDDLAGAGVPVRLIDMGDPGTAFDADTPRSALPAYDGPPEPAAPHTHEWGAAVADVPEDAPLEGPSLAPFEQAAEESSV